MEKRLSDKCDICTKLLEDPKLLPCFHIACRECIRNLFVKGKKKTKCPVNMCRKSIVCKNDDLESLPDALFIYHRRDSLKLKGIAEICDAICKLCCIGGKGEHLANALCDHCSYICATCSQQHDVDMQYSDHNVVSFLDLASKEDDVRLNALRRTRTMSQSTGKKGKLLCDDHPLNERGSYCTDCQVPVCSICIDLSHSTHKYITLKDVVRECRDHIEENLPSLSSTAQSLEKALVSFDSRKAVIESQRADLASAIDDNISRMINLLQDRRKKLHQQLNSFTDTKLHKLDDQRKTLERATGEMRRRELVTTELLSTATEQEIFSSFQFLEHLENIPELVELVPCEAPTLGLKQYVRKEFIDLCGRIEIYSKQADITKCVLEGVANLRAQARHYSSFDILVYDKENKPCIYTQNVTVQIKNCKYDYECFSQVNYKGMGCYSTLFYPEFRGNHSISVAINDIPMTTSPFTLKVSPAQSCFASVALEPRGIALTPDGEILICQWNGSKILKMNCHGELLKEIDTGFRRLTSLAVNSSGHIFVVTADEKLSGIIKCTQDGKVLKEIFGNSRDSCHDEKTSAFQNPRGVAVCPKGMVYICDKDNHQIQIYDEDLNFKNRYKLSFLRDWNKVKNDPMPNGIAFDNSGRRFIADIANCCIHVFNEDGYDFNFSTVQGEKMGHPESIAVGSNGLVFVSESNKNRVSIFQSSGEWVNTLGNDGSSDVDLNFPAGIAVDEDETVFICNRLNNRIQIF